MAKKLKVTPASADNIQNQDFGPIADRSCRDIFCLLLFILVWAALIIIAIIAFSTGDINLLLKGKDSYGDYCGIDNTLKNSSARDLTSKPYLYFLDLTSANGLQICVESCPNQGNLTPICDYGLSPSVGAYTERKCVMPYYNSRILIGRCVPTASSLAAQIIPPEISRGATWVTELIQIMINDIAAAWPHMLVTTGVCLVICFVWLFFLRYLCGVLAWTAIFLAHLALLGLAALCYLVYKSKTDLVTELSNFSSQLQNFRDRQLPANLIHLAANSALSLNSASGSVDRAVWQRNLALGLGIAFAVLFLILFVIIVALRKRIKIAVKVLKESSRAVSSMPLIVFYPVFTYICIVGISVLCGAVSLYIEVSPEENSLKVFGRPEVKFGFLKYLHWYNLFTFLWGAFFVLGVQQTTIAGAVATWYWSMDKNSLPRYIVLRALYRTLRYNLGSVAFGTLLIALTRFIRYVLAYLHSRLKGTSNKALLVILACMQCCFACLERFLKFLTKNAFIYMAIYGTSFMTSARRAIELLTRNALRLVALNFIGVFIMFLSKFSTTAISVGLLYAYLYYEPIPGDNVSVKFIPGICFLTAIGCWFVSSGFFGIYRMSADTIFLCFCEDCERNDGSLERPYYMSKSLAKLTDVQPKLKQSIKRKGKKKPATAVGTSDASSPV